MIIITALAFLAARILNGNLNVHAHALPTAGPTFSAGKLFLPSARYINLLEHRKAQYPTAFEDLLLLDNEGLCLYSPLETLGAQSDEYFPFLPHPIHQIQRHNQTLSYCVIITLEFVLQKCLEALTRLGLHGARYCTNVWAKIFKRD